VVILRDGPQSFVAGEPACCELLIFDTNQQFATHTLRCLQNYAESRNPAHRKAFGEAETWILDRKAHGPFAFETICEALTIQPDHLRDGIRQWRTQLSNGPDSRRLQRRSVHRSEPTASLVRRRLSHSGPSRTDAWTAGLFDR
jgi:hypothetical protein